MVQEKVSRELFNSTGANEVLGKLQVLRSRARRNVEPALDGGTGQAALQPAGHLHEAAEVNQVARLIEPNQIAHPA